MLSTLSIFFIIQLVGGQFDAEKNFRIKDASIVLLLLELARYSNNAVKVRSLAFPLL